MAIGAVLIDGNTGDGLVTISDVTNASAPELATMGLGFAGLALLFGAVVRSRRRNG